MTQLRRLARDVARASSYRKTRTTDLFHQEFERIWRLDGNHPQFSKPWNAAKKNMKGGKRRGHRRSALMRAFQKIKESLSR